jgi:hypothetical protein
MKRLVFVLCAMATVSCAGPDTSARPEARPGTAGTTADGSSADNKSGGFFSSLRPVFRASGGSQPAQSAAGSVCGDPSIKGEVIGRVPGEMAGCGVENAVQVSSVSGVVLSMNSTMDCGTARALKSWIDSSAKPALASKGGGLREIKVAAHYACRARNNAKTGRVSEHGKGRAIDISGFELVNGSEISVLTDWNAGSSSRALQRMHAEACGPFGTVLGPRANRFHLDHFHFDTARYRNGTYCR